MLFSGPPPEGFRVRRVTQDGDGLVTSVQSVPAAAAPHTPPVPDGHQVVGVSTLFDASGAVAGQWVKTRAVPDVIDPFDFLDAATRYARALPAHDPVPAPAVSAPDDLLNVFVWGDPHIGLLSHARETGVNFDLKIATRELRRSAQLLAERAPPAKHALFVEVGDLWHAENDAQLTPRGKNKLDVDGRRAKILDEGLAAVQYMLDRLLSTHDRVTVVLVPGNHDPDMSLVTRVVLQAFYRNEPRLTVLDNADPWIYYRFGQTLFLMTHGDKKVRPQELGEIMLADRPLDAGACTHRVALTGHIHHKNVQEFRWGRWESFGSLCAPDFFHHASGYRSQRVAEVVTHHAVYGERSRVRLTHAEIVESTKETQP